MRAALRYAAFVVASALATCSMLAGSCPGDGDGLTASGDPASGAFAEIQALFDANCTRCHAPGGIGYENTGGDAANGLDLTAGRSRAALVDQPTFEIPAQAPRWRVLTGQPDSSYIVQKVTEARPKAGSRMPLDGPPFLTGDEIGRIRDWITTGATAE